MFRSKTDGKADPTAGQTSSTKRPGGSTSRGRKPPRSGSRAPLWRAIATLAALGVAAALAFTGAPRLGLDLSGGTQIVLETQDTDRVQADAEATDRALTILRGRVDALGVAEPTLARSGENRIIVELPGIQDPREAAEVIGKTAQLTFHQVTNQAATPEEYEAAQTAANEAATAQAREDAEADGDDPAEVEPVTDGAQPTGQPLVLPDESGAPVALAAQALDGNGVSDAAEGQPEGGLQWVVNVSFNGTGAPAWGGLVQAACADPANGQRIAIVLDNEIISSPGIVPALCQSGGGSSTSITGDFTLESAKDLAVLIKGGSLPVPVDVIEQRTVGPTLGAAAIDASIEAGIIGIALTGIFIVLVYRFVGFLATIALATYALISYAILIWLGATLTLPGLAGFVLAIGLAIDANVLVFERAREEYALRRGDGLASALDTGYKKAWSAILDSNITTLLAAGLLFFLASGPVRGFGVTLSIGVIASMLSALVIARVLTESYARRRFADDRPALSGIAGNGRFRTWLTESGPYIMRRSGLWIGITVAVAVVSIGGILARGLNLGVEFTGGRILEFSTAQAADPETVRTAVGDAGFPSAVVQESSGDGQNENITVRTDQITNDEAVTIEDAVASSTGGEVTKERDELIGPSLGQELRNQALIAFAIAVAAQMIYLAFRFRWTFAAGAVLSMASVVLTVVGVFAWWGKPIDGVFLAAILSIIGLAVNDTIVIFDRIREKLRDKLDKPLRQEVNDAILATIPRTINTGLGAMFILAALAFLGGDSLTDFAIALLIGLSVGILSTIFTASAIAVVLQERFPQKEKSEKKQADPYADIVHAGRESGTS
ncbi:protein translocase subunit SecD [Solicola sp. PLA-1-18]|uniref:protein translocase subunit SecD n=1 Tax=Solicola sp. PLA-1-18 TaxID=3380532 RepID=UPI003B80C4FF